jgi:hypothetical protein
MCGAVWLAEVVATAADSERGGSVVMSICDAGTQLGEKERCGGGEREEHVYRMTMGERRRCTE